MKLNINYVEIENDKRLNDFIQKKVDKLETFYDRIIEGEVYLRPNNTSVDSVITELKIYVPGQSLFAKEQADSFEAGIDGCVEALRRQIRKLKEKQASHPQQP
ncbi:ribosome hibernation-promoting factor, HPF/YfiA family [Cesiribacter sp. SM1]|uniref:ribosome hibernation-promoting factor, HPF/YfiA family n=1 Tax=Cesiribacter sp. SM1 TaxID=2861196 RepID=UPI001CD73151|nr:ribosome-associated translation inhibitor RaiA [Cesiribacter sp. SM1]